MRAAGEIPVWTNRSMRKIESEAAPNTARGEKSILEISEKVDILISMSRTRCKTEGVNKFMASAAAGRLDQQDIGV